MLRQRVPRAGQHHTLTCGKTGWGTVTHNRVLNRAVAKELREVHVPISIEDSTPFNRAPRGESAPPLRMDIVTAPGSLFHGDRSLHSKSVLIDLTLTHPCTSTRMTRHAHLPGSAVDDAATMNRRKYLGTFPATSYHLLPLAVSGYGEIGVDGQKLIKAIAEARVRARGEPSTPQDHRQQVGAHIAGIRRRLSCALNEALSLRTRAHLYRQNVYSLGPLRAPLDSTTRAADRQDQSSTRIPDEREASLATTETPHPADPHVRSSRNNETTVGAPTPGEQGSVEQAGSRGSPGGSTPPVVREPESGGVGDETIERRRRRNREYMRRRRARERSEQVAQASDSASSRVGGRKPSRDGDGEGVGEPSVRRRRASSASSPAEPPRARRAGAAGRVASLAIGRSEE